MEIIPVKYVENERLEKLFKIVDQSYVIPSNTNELCVTQEHSKETSENPIFLQIIMVWLQLRTLYEAENLLHERMESMQCLSVNDIGA